MVNTTGRSLRNLAGFTGLSCVAIGIYHFALGTASVPGATDANATVDSRERFYSAYFAGYGLAWLGAARKSPIRATEIRLLAGLMLVSAVGRVISLVNNGRPHWFQEVLTAVEFVVPAAFFALIKAELSDGRREGVGELAALAAELPAVARRTMCAGLLGAAVLLVVRRRPMTSSSCARGPHGICVWCRPPTPIQPCRKPSAPSPS